MLNISERGEGSEPVLLLHGFLGSGRNLGSLARRWAEQQPELRLLLADLPGHGDSPPLAAPTLEALTGPVVELLRARDIQRVMGHSLGGRVALACRRGLGRPLHVTLLDISPAATAGRRGLGRVLEAFVAAPPHAESREAMAQHLRAHDIGEPLVQWLLLNLARTDEGVSWKVDRAALEQLSQNTGAESLWDTLAMPGDTTCIRGAASDFVTQEDVERLRGAGCPVHDVAGAGHFVHVDDLNAVVHLLTGASSG